MFEQFIVPAIFGIIAGIYAVWSGLARWPMHVTVIFTFGMLAGGLLGG